jgi:hypothetical protein
MAKKYSIKTFYAVAAGHRKTTNVDLARAVGVKNKQPPILFITERCIDTYLKAFPDLAAIPGDE